MKTRSIEELHDKYIGHRKFAKVVDILIEQKYKVTDIEEFNEKFKFKVNGFDTEYAKDWKASSKCYVEWIKPMIKALEDLRNWQNEKIK